MDESSAQDSIERVKKLVNFLSENSDKSIDIIVVGGTAMSFYGDYRATTDIDAEILNCPEDLYKASLEYLKENKIQFNIDEDFDGWGMVPMPPGYRDRAIEIYKEGNVTVKTLEPLDFIISKLRRGTDIDIEDAEKIMSRNGINKKAIKERVSEISFIKTEETFWFNQRLERFINERKIQESELITEKEPHTEQNKNIKDNQAPAEKELPQNKPDINHSEQIKRKHRR